MELDEIKRRIETALDTLYLVDNFLIRNGLCERSLNHRFAMHLQTLFPEYFVDCEYNKSHVGDANIQKRLSSERFGNYVDMIVGKRNRDPAGDFICFETKKWNNTDRNAIAIDAEKLSILTDGNQFGYQYGFQLTYAPARENVDILVYQHGTASEW